MRTPLAHQRLQYYWVLTVLVPVVSVWIADAVVSAFTGRPYSFSGQFGPRLIRTIIVASPFLALTFFAKRKLGKSAHAETAAGLRGAAWLLVVATLLLWGWFTYDMIASSGGFDIGIAIVLILSPLYMAGLILPGYYAGRSRYRKAHPGDTPVGKPGAEINRSSFRWLFPLLILSAGILSPVLPRLIVPMIAPAVYLDSLTRIFVDDPTTGRAYLIWMLLPFLLLSLYCLSAIWNPELKKPVFRSRVTGFLSATVAGFALATWMNIPRTTPQVGQMTGIYYPVIIFAVMVGGYFAGLLLMRLIRGGETTA